MEALDSGVRLLLAEVVVPAQPLSVVEAGRATAAVRGDVVALAHSGIAVGGSAAPVAQQQEPLQRGWELARLRLDGDDLPGGGVREQLSQDRPDLRPVRAEAVLGRVLRRGEHLAQLLSQSLGGDGAVALDVRGVAVLGGEQRTVRDDHADVEGLEVHPAVAAQQGSHHGVGHDRAVPGLLPLGTTALRLEGESFVDALRIQSGEMGAERRHAVLPGGQRHVAGLAGEAMAVRSAVGVELADGRGDRAPPGLDPGALHLGQPLVEDLVHLSSLLVRQRRGRGGRGVGDARGDRAVAEGVEHARHRADEATSGGEARARGGGGTVGRESDVHRGAPIGLADELLERREEVVLVRNVVARRVDAIPAMGFGEGDEGARLERGERA
jgi:hypothetical protein